MTSPPAYMRNACLLEKKKKWERKEKHQEEIRLIMIPLFGGKPPTINKHVHSFLFPSRISFLIINLSHIV